MPLSFKITWVYLFLVFSRGTEFVYFAIGVNLGVVLPVSAVAIAANLMNGGVIRSILSPCGILFTAFSGWLLLCVPFAVWRGGALQTIRDRWLIAYLTFLIVASLATLPQCRKLFDALVISELTMLAVTQLLGVQKQGRLSLQGGTLGNANDLAIHVLIGFPFIYFFLISGRMKSMFLKMLLFASCGLLAVVVLGTGSRSGLLVFLALSFIMFWRMPLAGKVGVVAVSLIVLPLGLSLATRTAIDRFRTLLSDTSEIDSASMAEATASKDARMDLLIESLKLTQQHPIFGVGPGMFSAATGWRWTEGVGMGWRQTHNTYTEVSSETGIPGLSLYLAAMFWCFHRLRCIWRAVRGRPEFREIHDMSLSLFLSLLAFAFSGLFSSMAYHTHLPMLAGIITAFNFAVRPMITHRSPVVAQPLTIRSATVRV